MEQQIIARIQCTGMSGAEWGWVLDNELVRVWREGMSSDEVVFWTAALATTNGFRVPNTLILLPQLVSRLDEIILDQTEDFGWRMCRSEVAQFRFSRWSPQMDRRYGEACARAKEIENGERRVRINDIPAIRSNWHEAIEELRFVLNRMRDQFIVLRRSPSHEELRQRFREIVQSSAECIRTAARLEAWMTFIEGNPNEFQDALGLNRKRPAAVEFFLLFIATVSGYKVETIQQKYFRVG